MQRVRPARVQVAEFAQGLAFGVEDGAAGREGREGGDGEVGGAAGGAARERARCVGRQLFTVINHVSRIVGDEVSGAWVFGGLWGRGVGSSHRTHGDVAR